MIKVYIGKRLSLAILPVLFPNLGIKEKGAAIFNERAYREISEKILELVERPNEADVFLVPHNYFSVKNNLDYLGEFINLARKFRKPLIIFAYGDSDEEIDIPEAIILRTSQYRFKKRDNEIIMPAYVEDLGGDCFKLRKKSNNIPVVGFCGWAGFSNWRQRGKYFVRNFIYDLKSLRDHNIRVRKQGLYFRIKATGILKNSEAIRTNFILRKSYSGHVDTIGLDFNEARREYIKNILDSDFTLTVKGDGNYSARFYEVLSLGRIPILVDTDCVLPLENEIDYKKFILRVDYRDLGKIDKIVGDFYKNISESDFLKTQEMAREIFDRYFKIDKFLKYLFSDILERNI